MKDRASTWLQKGFEQRAPSMIYLAFDQNLPADMRSDPRVQYTLRRMNVPN
jgi:hypothetical protein